MVAIAKANSGQSTVNGAVFSSDPEIKWKSVRFNARTRQEAETKLLEWLKANNLDGSNPDRGIISVSKPTLSSGWAQFEENSDRTKEGIQAWLKKRENIENMPPVVRPVFVNTQVSELIMQLSTERAYIEP